MLRPVAVTLGLAMALTGLPSDVRAQMMFPGGFGAFGMSEWGANPSAGYMAGLGAFARGQGAYQLDKAKADAINVETMAKWNKALHARQVALREQEQKEAAQRDAALARRVERLDLRDGITLNNLLAEIYDIDPTATKTGRANTPLSARAIREIPFEWDSEAISLCLGTMTGRNVPPPLMAPIYGDEREALRAAVRTAMEEDTKGTVTRDAIKRINEAVASFRAKFLKNTATLELGYNDALTYFNTVASLSRLLNDPGMMKLLEKLDTNSERTLGELIAFMEAYNLRFGRATSERQLEIYGRLVPILTAIRDSVKTADYTASPPDRTGEGLETAAKDAFKPMTWDQLEAHARSQ